MVMRFGVWHADGGGVPIHRTRHTAGAQEAFFDCQIAALDTFFFLILINEKFDFSESHSVLKTQKLKYDTIIF